MNILFWGLTLGVAGKVLVVLAVLHMHHSMIKEHGIVKSVYLTYKQERVLTFIGLLLIFIGYFLEVYFYAPAGFFSCYGAQCAASLGIIAN